MRSSSFREEEDDEEALRWAALERLPTFNRVRKGIFRNMVGDRLEVDVDKLQVQERKVVLDRLVNSVDNDWEKFFHRMRRRFDRFRSFYFEPFTFYCLMSLFLVELLCFNLKALLLIEIR